MYYFTLMLKKRLVYRWELTLQVAGKIIFVLISIYLWKYLYTNNEIMIQYMIKYTVLSNLINLAYNKEIMNFWSDKILTGDYVLNMIKPINLLRSGWEQILATILTDFVIIGLPLVIFFAPYLTGLDLVPVAIIAVVLGHIMYTLIYSAIGILAFVLLEVWSIGRFMDDTIRIIGGSFIPLTLLPDTLQSIAYVLPFRYLYNFPLEILLGNIDKKEIYCGIITLICWIVFFAVFVSMLYRSALKRAVVNGG